MPLGNSNAFYLTSRSILDPVTLVLTITPHQKLYLKAAWDYKLDDGKWIHEILENYHDEVEGRRTYRVHDPTVLQARLTVELIKNTAPLIADTEFVLHLKGQIFYRR